MFRGSSFYVARSFEWGIEGIGANHLRPHYGDGWMFDSRLANSPWNVSEAILCQVTLSGNIDYGLQAYQLRLKATRMVRRSVGLFQADMWLMTPNHNLTLMLLRHRETDLWTLASNQRTEHKWYIQSKDLHSSLLQIYISYRCQRAVNIDMDF